MPNHDHNLQQRFSSILESVEAFVAEHGLAAEWRAWQETHPLQHPEPPGSGIDFAADMRDQAKGDRRAGERRRGERRQGERRRGGNEEDAPRTTGEDAGAR